MNGMITNAADAFRYGSTWSASRPHLAALRKTMSKTDRQRRRYANSAGMFLPHRTNPPSTLTFGMIPIGRWWAVAVHHCRNFRQQHQEPWTFNRLASHSASAWRGARYSAALTRNPLRPAERPCYKHAQSSNREALVDIALRFNVLAVCAVFTFVGAVLLGAF